MIRSAFYAACLLLPASNATAQSLTKSSARLAPDRTLALVEIASIRQLAKHAADLPVLSVARAPAARDFFESIAAQNRASWRLWRRLPRITEQLAALDGGLTTALVIDPADQRSGPALHYLVANSKRDPLRALVAELNSYIPKNKFREDEVTIPDTPVSGRILMARNPQRSYPRVFANVVGPRHAAFATGQLSVRSRDQAAKKAACTRLARQLAHSAGVQSRGRGVGLGEPRFEAGTRVLGRAAFFFARPSTELDLGDDQNAVEARLAAMGLRSWEGAQAFLLEREGVCRERIELYTKTIEGPSWVHAIDTDPSDSLGRVAEALPADTLAALQLGFRPRKFGAWLTTLMKTFGNSPAQLEALQSLARPFAKQADAGGAHDSLTVAILRPVGTMFPEPVLLVRRPRKAGKQSKAEVVTLARHLASSMFSKEQDKIRVRARGGATPHAFFRIPEPEGPEVFAIPPQALGGGYLTVLRVGDYLAIGFNPRTMRKLGKSVMNAETLAARKHAGFMQRFPANAARPLEAWIDWNGVSEVMRGVEPAALSWLALAAEVSTVRGIRRLDAEELDEEEGSYKVDPRDTPPELAVKLPSFAKLMADFQDEAVFARKSEFGFVLEHEGSLVLSAVAISATMSVASFVSAYQELLEDGYE